MVGIGTGPATGILAVLFADESLVWDRYCKLRQGKLAGLDLPPTLTMRTAQGRYGALYRVSGASGRGVHVVSVHPFVDAASPIAEAPASLPRLLGREGVR